MAWRVPVGPTAELPLAQSTGGSSGSFLVRADDGNRYWCKSTNNQQHPRVPCNEQIVGRFAASIPLAVCAVSLIYVPADLIGWEFRPGATLVVGWVLGSIEITGSIETHELNRRSNDDNARRHTGLFALHDWLFGSDSQWLTQPSMDEMYFSHDHGHYFPSGPGWTQGDLDRVRDDDHSPGWDTTGLDRGEAERIAAELDRVTADGLTALIEVLPPNWDISDEEIRAIAEWSAHRASRVAERLRLLAPNL